MMSKLGMMWVMISGFAKKMPARVKGYVRENWGAPFIVGFMLLLMVAAVSLSMGLATLADGVAIAAYYALVGGVVLQLVCFLRYNKKNGEKNHESS
jgi:heme/copper-type cytochrome/quinol oxidase subunit 4